MQYFTPLLSFLAAAVAIRGGTWDASKSGFGRVTWTGRIAIALAIVGLVGTYAQIYRDSVEKHRREYFALEAISAEAKNIDLLLRQLVVGVTKRMSDVELNTETVNLDDAIIFWLRGRKATSS
jgi:hypothetical protein